MFRKGFFGKMKCWESAAGVRIAKFKSSAQKTVYSIMVPTDHDFPFSRSFQGILRFIFKEFSRTFFVLSNIHSRKNDQQWTFQIRHKETTI